MLRQKQEKGQTDVGRLRSLVLGSLRARVKEVLVDTKEEDEGAVDGGDRSVVIDGLLCSCS